jgi:hypothetical protein
MLNAGFPAVRGLPMLSRLLLVGLVLLGGGGLYRHFILGDWGWERIHPAEFSADGCDIYYAMLGLGQDPADNPANAPLVERCQAQAQDIAWVPSQIGDVLRFDRPSLVRLRVDVIDMAPDYQESYPTLAVEFPYPPVPLPADLRWRPAGALQSPLSAEQTQKLTRYWNPSWANLFAQWTLGRGNHEVWLGAAAIRDPQYCAAVEPDPKHRGRLCVMHLYNTKGEPVTFRLPLERKLEWRFEVLDICRFGGRVRRWQNPLAQMWFGPEEHADAGCQPFVASAAAKP